jgi:hypothetical protein
MNDGPNHTHHRWPVGTGPNKHTQNISNPRRVHRRNPHIRGAPYPAAAFPNSIEAAWGYYKVPDANSKKIERDKPIGKKSAAPALPDLA